jgi:hypothetical protein
MGAGLASAGSEVTASLDVAGLRVSFSMVKLTAFDGENCSANADVATVAARPPTPTDVHDLELSAGVRQRRTQRGFSKRGLAARSGSLSG